MTEFFYQELKIPGPLPGLNDMVANGPRGRFRYNRLKKRWAETIAYLAAAQGLKPIKSAHFSFIFYEPNMRRDPSNFVGGAVKFIEDALQAAGYLAGDGWDNILSYRQEWFRAKDMGEGSSVFVVMDDCEEWKETEHERREKGKNKFRRRNQGAGKASSAAGKARPRGQAKSAKVSARGTRR